MFSIIGAALAGRYALRNGEARDFGPSTFAGGVGGVLVAAFAVAACRTVEPLLGSHGAAALAYWAVFGGLVAWGSLALVPYSKKPKGAT